MCLSLVSSFGGEFEDFSEFDAPEQQISDPLIGYNRFMSTFNDIAFGFVIRPIVVTYRFILPKPIRTGIYNMFDTIKFPIRTVNLVLQGKFEKAGLETTRSAINLTLGLGGFFEVADNWFSMTRYHEDFGQTLAVWGVPSGPFLVIPFIGPSTLRDAFGRLSDVYVDPAVQLDHEIAFSATFIEQITRFSLNLEQINEIRRNNVNLYYFSRSAYYGYRREQIAQ